MSRIPLIGKAYQERGLIASAQETINLYLENNQKDPAAPVPFSYYQTPGFILASTPNAAAATRCQYRTSIGTAYVVIGSIVYFLEPNNALVFVGSITDRTSQVIMADNGLVAVLVDGVNGWVIDLATNEFTQIIDPSFYGAAFVLFLDTFFVFNRPATNQFYISLSQVNYGLLSSTAIFDGSIVGGAAYTNGVYTNVPLTGGSGSGATATINVSGNVVNAVDIGDPGKNYVVGDVLSAVAANIGGTGAGFTFTVTANAPAFDPLDIAAKSGSADPIVALLTIHKELWLVGALTTEVWIGTGAADFYFQLVQGAYIDHGNIAPYSSANTDIVGFWLMQDRVGKNIVVQSQGYDVTEISTPFLVKEFSSYTTTDDAVGFCFQIGDHAFYCLAFPTANKTWLYQLKTKEWSRWCYLYINTGNLQRHRANCAMYFNQKNYIGDWENGNVYELSLDVATDNGVPIVRIKTFYHMVGDNYERLVFNSFDADITVGTQDPTIEEDAMLALSWSDDRGKTFGFPVEQSIGRGGEYLSAPSWNRLGLARDKVFKLQWSVPIPNITLNGGFATVRKART